jgi:5-methylcytosine-specific restriction enzyme A
VDTARSEFDRDNLVKRWILEQANGLCEGCGMSAPFFLDDGSPFLEVHHVRQLANGGSDQVTNAVALCPNCHRRSHFLRDRTEFAALLYSNITRLVKG